MSSFIAGVLDDAVKRRESSRQPPFQLVTVRGARLRAGVDLDRPWVIDARDDEDRFGRERR